MPSPALATPQPEPLSRARCYPEADDWDCRRQVPCGTDWRPASYPFSCAGCGPRRPARLPVVARMDSPGTPRSLRGGFSFSATRHNLCNELGSQAFFGNPVA